MKFAGIIVAAGSGRRFGFKKQFADLNGKWVLEYSVDIFRKICDSIVIVAQKDDIEKIKRKFDFAVVIEGGKERMYSVYNGLSRVSCDVVIIHDAARPVVKEGLIKKLLEIATTNGSCVPVLNISETVKKVENGKIVDTVDRSSLYIAQTPQVFDYAQLKSAYDRAIKNDKNYTDESSIWEEFYGPVCTIIGDRRNIKITIKEDLEIVRCLLG